MSVAEKPAPATVSNPPQARFAFVSLVGGIFLLVGLWLLFGALPTGWAMVVGSPPIMNEFLSGALLLILTIAGAVALAQFGRKLEASNAVPGSRAGAVWAALLVFLALRLSLGLGYLCERQEFGPMGAVLTLGVAAGFLFLIYKFLGFPGVQARLRKQEENGWYHAEPFKGTQGVKVRRATVIAVLVVGIAGIITMVNNRTLGTDRLGPNDWEWVIPFTSTPEGDHLVLPLMYKIHLVVPVLLLGLLIWFAWRLVNWPTFADFLIATEAEMNKVSWTTRKRLFQDTIVVLVTVFLLTFFLFVIDLLWIRVLSFPAINVLQVDLRKAKQQQMEKTQW